MCRSILISALFLASCAIEPSHESFVQMLDNSIGKSVDAGWLTTMCSTSYFLTDTEVLPNGNERHRHVRPPIRNVGECPFSCEVNPKSRLVVSIMVEGTAQNCVQFP